MKQNNKPAFLYRGIVLPYDELENFNLSTTDLLVPYNPIIDENGNKVVLDGNEYGVYMTDNSTMVSNVYGNIHGNGKPIRDDITFDIDRKRILIPSVGISYKINTQDIDVRKPHIINSLKGHYNNGFQGDEWIADKIPSTNYKVSRIRIGSDVLHEAENIPIIDGNVEQAKMTAVRKLQIRKYRLDSLINELSKMTPVQRLNIGYLEFSILKDIYGPDGVRYTNKIDISNNQGKLKHLLTTFYHRGNGTIDFSTLRYIEGLKQKLAYLSSQNSLKTVEQMISDDIKINGENKSAFVQSKTDEGVEFTTRGFDKKREMMSDILNILLSLHRTKDAKDIDFTERQLEMEPANLQPQTSYHSTIENPTVYEETKSQNHGMSK